MNRANEPHEASTERYWRNFAGWIRNGRLINYFTVSIILTLRQMYFCLQIFRVMSSLTSDMTLQIWKMHWVIASLPPLMVTALSVEFGSISLATWIEAPVTSRISLILEPPLPIKEPHWEAGTMSRNVIGGRGTVFGATKLFKSWKEKKNTFKIFFAPMSGNFARQENWDIFPRFKLH